MLSTLLVSFIPLLFSSCIESSSFEPARRQDASNTTNASIPDYVFTYAPIVYLDINDYFLPSDIGAQINNTMPEMNFSPLADVPANLSLSNMVILNEMGGCTSLSDCSIFLTSRENVSQTPSWLGGVYPNPDSHATENATSAAVIVNDHGDGTVDAFYMYFYAFNLGNNVFGGPQGNHVGDWEHSMVRFMNGQPTTVWLSTHSDGNVYTYDALEKYNGGQRPVVYSGLGTHATYSTPGDQTRTISIIQINDTTSKGPLWDPLLSAYYYTFDPAGEPGNNGTFTPATVPEQYQTSANNPSPVSWLYFVGYWGDKQYNSSSPIQRDLGNLNITYAYTDGPQGPLSKQLERDGTCPPTNEPCVTSSQIPAVSGATATKTISRTYIPPGSTETVAIGPIGSLNDIPKSGAGRSSNAGSVLIAVSGLAMLLSIA